MKFKVDKTRIEIHKMISPKHKELEFPLKELSVHQSFKAPLAYENLVRMRIQSIKKLFPKRKYVTRVTADQKHLRVWRTK